MAKKGKFIVMSPDGFPLERDAQYKDKKEWQRVLKLKNLKQKIS